MTPREAIAAGFAALVAVAVALDLAARRPGASVPRPLGATIAAAVGNRGVRVAALVFWLWLGWHFLAR